jgi:phosphoribosylformimino-5-aminoimidazole carboxamide ribonucleotide (ProFAR) isomerase
LAKAGATQIIVGSSAFKQGKLNLPFLRALNRALPCRKIVIALDTYKGKITTHGWRESVALQPAEVMSALEPYCGAFLCTDVDNEGTLSGANLEYFAKLREATAKPIIAAGGIRTQREIAKLAKLNMDGAVGMALYKNLLR